MKDPDIEPRTDIPYDDIAGLPDLLGRVNRIKSEPWTSYLGAPWTGTDPETHGDPLLYIWRQYGGVGVTNMTDRGAKFLFPELSDYVVELHNLALKYGGIDEMRILLEQHDQETP